MRFCRFFSAAAISLLITHSALAQAPVQRQKPPILTKTVDALTFQLPGSWATIYEGTPFPIRSNKAPEKTFNLLFKAVYRTPSGKNFATLAISKIVTDPARPVSPIKDLQDPRNDSELQPLFQALTQQGYQTFRTKAHSTSEGDTVVDTIKIEYQASDDESIGQPMVMEEARWRTNGALRSPLAAEIND